jgi:murein DD-endopeptidase MepM/ murein hydrolase activator NlpD
MRRRFLLVSAFALALALATPAAGQEDPVSEKARVDQRIAELQREIDAAKGREGVLTSQLSAVVSELRAAESAVDEAQGSLDRLEAELARERTRLERLTARLAVQTRRLARLEREHSRAVEVLEQRVRDAYIDQPPDMISFLVSASSFADLIDSYEFVSRIGAQDRRIADEVETAKLKAAAERRATVRTRALTAATVAVISARTEEAEALAAQSASLAAAIRDAQAKAASSGAAIPSASGLIWPVNGTVTSGFGMRWGRMHEGIDIAAPTGTAIWAAAAGTVIYAGWLGGYGNLVVVDHGNGLSTAYAHASAIVVSLGQQVAQGQTVALVGSTGHSTGPHLHFEVRVNGAAVDPLLYL